MSRKSTNPRRTIGLMIDLDIIDELNQMRKFHEGNVQDVIRRLLHQIVEERRKKRERIQRKKD